MNRWITIIADDDAGSTALIRESLSPLRYDILALSNPKAIGEAIRNRQRALVLAAPSLPGLDPSKLCEELRTAPVFSYVIFLVEHYAPETMTAAFEAGADDAIVKPLIAAELRARLQHAARVLALEDSCVKLEGEGILLADIAARATFHSVRYLRAQLDHELVRARRFAHAVALVLAAVRTTSVDERIMRGVGCFLSEHFRSGVDWVARHGSHSFAFVLPETGLLGARRAAERLHAELRSESVLTSVGIPHQLTFNFGLCAFDPDKASLHETPDSDALLAAAEAYLRDAARKGPNQIAGGPVSLTLGAR